VIVYGLDPGTTESALVGYDDTTRRVCYASTKPNGDLLSWLTMAPSEIQDMLVIEQIQAMGMSVGASVFETVFWSGRFAEAWPGTWDRVSRRDVKLYLCGSMRAKDANVRQALLDMFGGPDAKGTKAKPGPLHGVKGHEFAALAVAITWLDTKRELGSAAVGQ
jgi:hypothetical protein